MKRGNLIGNEFRRRDDQNIIDALCWWESRDRSNVNQIAPLPGRLL